MTLSSLYSGVTGLNAAGFTRHLNTSLSPKGGKVKHLPGSLCFIHPKGGEGSA